jgi:surfeit locus 1 family protein
MSKKPFTFSVFGNHFYFTPKLAILAFLAIALFVGFGLWQLQQASAINNLIELVNSRSALAPLEQEDLNSGRDLRFYQIQLRGSFDNEHQLLLTHRNKNNQPGYDVLTPFKPEDSPTTILVNRGWVPYEENLVIPPVADTVAITGTLLKPLNYFGLSASYNESKIEWPLLIKYADTTRLSKILNVPLYSYIVLLNPDSSNGFVREWADLANANALIAEKKRMLANQWFILALGVFAAFIFMNIHHYKD